MAPNQRPKLTQLFVPKGQGTPAPANAPEEAHEPQERQERRAKPAKAVKVGEGKKDERKPILLRLDPEEKFALRMIALENGTTVQKLGEDAMRDIIKRYRGK